jgi:hypothetical protein
MPGVDNVTGSADFVPNRSPGTEIATIELDQFVTDIPNLVAAYESWIATQRIQGVQRYPILRNRSRRRF